jgi:ssDNA-binding Zn-finger/Zn-ribbon topoisomerase 1
MRPGFHKNGKCKECKTGVGVDRVNTKTGEEFIGCINYPRCKNSAPAEVRLPKGYQDSHSWDEDE